MKTFEVLNGQKNNPFLKAKFFLFCFVTFVMFIILLGSCKKVEVVNNQIVSQESSDPVSNKPNVIVILGDDIGFEVPQYFGGQSYQTPRINQMAAQGIQFNQVYSTPLCSPSRFMLLTGKYNFRNYGLWGIMDTTNRTIANMLRDKGYKTLVAGKWQLDGGDASIHALGFDDYLVYTPYQNGGYGKGSRYKDPTLYKAGDLLPADSMKGKYGEDVLVDYINNFIDSNKKKPFFIYYPVCLCHYPYCPTPDDADFASWDVKTSKPDEKYLPSMVNYMDKKIGEVLDKVNSSGLASKTIVLYVCDNGTGVRINSIYKNKNVQGGKGHPWISGTREPMIVWSPGNIAPHQINNNLIDFTDFLPTIADIARIPRPTTYGILDGVSFYPNLMGQAGTPRDWVFCHYDENEEGEGLHPIQRWVNNTNYKLFDTTGLFYNIKKDPLELSPIPNSKLTPQEKTVKTNFQQVLNMEHN